MGILIPPVALALKCFLVTVRLHSVNPAQKIVNWLRQLLEIRQTNWRNGRIFKNQIAWRG